MMVVKIQKKIPKYEILKKMKNKRNYKREIHVKDILRLEDVRLEERKKNRNEKERVNCIEGFCVVIYIYIYIERERERERERESYTWFNFKELHIF